MREDLIINGQYVDQGLETNITLEYISNLLNDPGKISLSHSYTLKLPRTTTNARILDLPEIPAHESTKTRRYLSAAYIRNGVNLIGDNAYAYITSASDEQYEIVLVWDDIPELRALAESDATINELPGLPRLQWVGASYGMMSAGALFAKYTSSNAPKNSEYVDRLTHPCMLMKNLLQRIMNNAGLQYTLSPNALDNLVVLAAPNHKPDYIMIIATAALVRSNASDPPYYSMIDRHIATLQGSWYYYDRMGHLGFTDSSPAFLLKEANSCSVAVQFKLNNPNPDEINHEGVVCRLLGATTSEIYPDVVLAEIPLIKDSDGYACVGKVDIDLPKGLNCIAPILYTEEEKNVGAYIAPYGSSRSLFDIMVPYKNIDPSISNVFPLSGNLPDIEQWSFVRNCMLIGGLTPVVSQSRLHLYTVSEILNVTRAVDWTNKLYADSVKVMPRLGNDWAQHNLFKFKEDEESTSTPDFSIDISDSTLKTNREWANLDFAASMNNTAIHYTSIDKGATYEDVDIEPRFFRYDNATQSLHFTPDLYGEGLKAKYNALQAIIEKPLLIEATVRLTEIDLATLDVTRPVYLAQLGRFYHVLKVQTGKTDACKVELLQLR